MNVSTGHLKQSIDGLRKRFKEDITHLDNLEKIVLYLEARGTFNVSEEGENKMEAYFRKWILSLQTKKPPVQTYEDFQAYVDRLGMAMVREQVEDWVGRKLAYAEIDHLAKKELGTIDEVVSN